MTWQVIEADCLEAMAEMEDDSIDAIVTDPPYGLEFMGKEWDRLGDIGRGSHAGPGQGQIGGQYGSSMPNYNASANVRCRRCRKWKWGHQPGDGGGGGLACQCDVPDFPSPRPDQARLMQQWHQAWATEALRVLKPGGHLLAFGGTRTYHRLACAIEDAGFEIRDSVIWLYGSGFPKSLDVSKAIDRARGDEPRWLAVGAWLKQHREAAGYTRQSIAPQLSGHTNLDSAAANMSNWENGLGFPTLERWAELKSLLSLPDDMDAEVWRLNGRKGQPGEGWEQREVVGTIRKNQPGGTSAFAEGGIGAYTGDDSERPIIGPAVTPEAQRWQGWGTALKPSHEPVVCAQKPLGIADWLAIIGSHLDRLESEWQAQEADPTTPTGEGADSSDQMATSPSESPATTSSSIVTSWRKCWAELSGAMSMSTTETATRLITDLETLSSCLEALTVESIPPSPSPTSGSPSLVVAVDNLFAAAVLSLRGILALSAGGPATESTAHPSPDAGAASPSPAHEPIVVARKPLIGTVAQNVERFGTGALNIAASRITSDGSHKRPYQPTNNERNVYGEQAGFEPTNAEGRWPANVALSHLPECQRVGERRVKGAGWSDSDAAANRGKRAIGDFKDEYTGKHYADSDGLETVEAWSCVEGCPVRLLDEQSGGRMHGAGSAREAIREADGTGLWGMAGDGQRYGDTGGASRFFATFQTDADVGGGSEEVRSRSTADMSARFRYVADTLCVLCGLPYVIGAGNPSPPTGSPSDTAPSGAQDELRPSDEGSEARPSTSAPPAEPSSRTTSATAASTAPSDASPPGSDKSDPSVRSAGNLCGSCETAIARALAEPPFSPAWEGHLGQLSIDWRKRQILTQSLALAAASPDSIDITRITRSLSLSFGSAPDATPPDIPIDGGGSGTDQARFGYFPKSSRRERNAGLEGFEERELPHSAAMKCATCGLPILHGERQTCECEAKQEIRQSARNSHPTVKPVDLMRWLCRLVTPPDGLVLDPFCGSGTTGIACVLEDFDFIGIEREPDYVEIARARIAWWDTHKDRADEILALSAKSERERSEHVDAGQLGLFGGVDVGGGGLDASRTTLGSGKEPLATADVSTRGRSIYGDYGEAVLRCSEHGASIPSGSTSYRCGCPIVRGEPPRRAAA